MSSTAIVVSEIQLKEAVQETGIIVSKIQALIDLPEPNEAVLAITKQLRLFLTEGESLTAQLRAIQVSDQDTADTAVAILRQRADYKSRVKEFFKPMKKDADAVHAAVCQSESFVLEGLNGVFVTIEMDARNAVDAWLKEQERLQTQRDIDAAKEQSKLDKQARDDAAKHAKALGAGEEAVQQIREAVLPVSPPKSAPVYTTPKGFSKKPNWQWRFTSGTEVSAILAILAEAVKVDKKGKKTIDKRWLGYLSIKEKSLNADAKTKQGTAEVPGVTFYDAGSTSIRK